MGPSTEYGNRESEGPSQGTRGCIPTWGYKISQVEAQELGFMADPQKALGTVVAAVH